MTECARSKGQRRRGAPHIQMPPETWAKYKQSLDHGGGLDYPVVSHVHSAEGGGGLLLGFLRALSLEGGQSLKEASGRQILPNKVSIMSPQGSERGMPHL